MVFEQPKTWAVWVPLAEFWYNTNFHTAIKTTPFEALYGYTPPQLSLGSVPKSCNQAVNEELEKRQKALRIMKEQLVKVQVRMKKYADMKRSERKFHVGDWVYLRLQPYRQISMKGKIGTHKLLPKFYGPFEVLEKLGKVAYKLSLPPGSLIHDVFHVSQLKKKVGTSVRIGTGLPLVSGDGKVKLEPIAFLDRRIVKKNNQVEVEVLVQWSNLQAEDAT
jgi:ribosomal protein S19E (S16A)